MNSQDIKRMLGVGMATMTEHLREYKDPFEPEERELHPLPIEPCAGMRGAKRGIALQEGAGKLAPLPT